jgi:hypothetical protein
MPKTVVTFLFLAFALMCSSGAEAEEAFVSPWQGEWLGAGSDSASFGITIKNCQSGDICDAEVFRLGDLGKSCLQRGKTAATANADELSIRLDRGPMVLRKNGDAIVSSDKVDPSCEITRAATDIRYSLRSRQPYATIPELGAGQCYRDPSAAMQDICTDKQILGVIGQAKSAPFAHVDTFWVLDRKLLDECNHAGDARACLIDGYGKKLAALRADSHGMEAYGQPGDPARAQGLLRRMSGVYKHRFNNGNVSGDKYQSEDIFEFVPISSIAAYAKIHLEFFNGHLCDLAGVVEYRKVDAFVFHDPEGDNAGKCLLTIGLDKSHIRFKDPNGNCSKFCGARGSLDTDEFDLGQRRTIRYMPLIEGSEEYRNAIAAYDERHKGDTSVARGHVQ